MDEQQTNAEREHCDFLRKIANEVYELVRDQTTMARFRSQVRLFCEKNEEHEREVEQLEKASLADPKLQKAIKEKEKEIWGKAWEEMTEDVKGRLKPATMGAFKTSHFERLKICYWCSPIPTMTGFKESRHGKSTQNGYGKRNIDLKTAWLVSTAYRPRAWHRP